VRIPLQLVVDDQRGGRLHLGGNGCQRQRVRSAGQCDAPTVIRGDVAAGERSDRGLYPCLKHL
jgi:hypothetical protein